MLNKFRNLGRNASFYEENHQRTVNIDMNIWQFQMIGEFKDNNCESTCKLILERFEVSE